MDACIVQEQQLPAFKHYCRVCKKGFMCGRALGGHMRAHGTGDESANMDDDDDPSDWEDKVGGSERTSNKRMYKLRTNPNRLKSVRVCENCGQEFFSWKSFLEHGKCSSDDGESLVSSPGSDPDESFGRRGHGWSKRKRSLRAKVGSFTVPPGCLSGDEEDEDLHFAKCLVELANARVFSPMTEPESSSCASASKDEERRNPVAEFLPPLSGSRVGSSLNKPNKTTTPSKGMFECKACKKVFTSHQALGGHRASHKKVKGCYAAKQDQINNNNHNDSMAEDDVVPHEGFLPSNKSSSSYQFELHGPTYAGASRRESKVHECSICHRVFSTGQALGGHKRCHWVTSNTYSHDTSITKFHFHDHKTSQEIHKSEAGLDLNLPAQGDRDSNNMSRPPDPVMNQMSLEVSTEIHLHPWYMNTNTNTNTNTDNRVAKNYNYNINDNNNKEKKESNKNINIVIDNGGKNNVDEDEADSKLKFARISGLKETSTSKGNSSQWLQVGIGSAAAEVGD